MLRTSIHTSPQEEPSKKRTTGPTRFYLVVLVLIVGRLDPPGSDSSDTTTNQAKEGARPDVETQGSLWKGAKTMQSFDCPTITTTTTVLHFHQGNIRFPDSSTALKHQQQQQQQLSHTQVSRNFPIVPNEGFRSMHRQLVDQRTTTTTSWLFATRSTSTTNQNDRPIAPSLYFYRVE